MPFSAPVATLPVRVQSAQASTSTATATATFASAPKAGNLVVAVAHCNVAVASISINTAGYSSLVANDFSSAPVRGIEIFTKIAGAAEGTTVQMTGTAGTTCRLVVVEYTNMAGPTSEMAPATADTTAGTTNSMGVASGTRPAVLVSAVAGAGNFGGWVSWALGATVETIGNMEVGEHITTTGYFTNQVGTWTTARDAGGVAVVFLGAFSLSPRVTLQAVNRAGTY